MVNSQQGHDMADYKLKRIPKYMKAMVFPTFPHTQSYFSPLNIIEPQNQSWWKQRCSGGGDLTGSPSASETSKGEMRCRPNLSSQGCQPMEKHQNILEFTKHHKKMKIYDFILKRNELWGVEDGSALTELSCLRGQSCSEKGERPEPLKGAEEGLGNRNCRLDSIIHPSPSLVGFPIRFQTMWRFNPGWTFRNCSSICDIHSVFTFSSFRSRFISWLLKGNLFTGT